jgi:hypothetical protein
MSDESQPSWWDRRPLWQQILIIVGAVVAFVLIWVWVPWLLYGKAAPADEVARLKAITDTRTALLAGLVGIGALGTLWLNRRAQRFTAETLRVGQENLQLAKRSQEQSFELAERGHLTDRYTKAIAQLGDDNLDVRLGGIYALERLATDSENDRDQTTIVEVLSAFVRVHSDPVYRLRGHLAWLGLEKLKQSGRERRLAEEHVGEYSLPVDVQAGVTVLGRLRVCPKVRRADLPGACLRKVKLDPEANLTGADLGDKADLTGAKLVGVNLIGVDLHGANLTEARLERAKLRKAWLAGAHLNKAHLVGADLTDVTLVGVWANGNWYSLGKARLELNKEDLSRADWSRADLSGADLTAAEGLAQEQLDEALGDSQTTLPTALHPPKRWSRAEGSEPG